MARQAAYYASPEWGEKRAQALTRAGGRCEYVQTWFLKTGVFKVRCPAKDRLHVHHKTNIRFGGNELDKDLQVLCAEHHALVETRDFSHRQRISKKTIAKHL